MGGINSPLNRIRFGLTVLLSVVVLATVGYRFGAEDFTWVDSLWMVVITISTVGYGESSGLSDAMQIFTVIVILVGICAASVTFSGLLQVVIEGEVQKAFGRRRMTRELDNLKNHVIICGYGRTGRHLAEGLADAEAAYVIVDNRSENVSEALAEGRLCIQGDATEEGVLLDAGVQRAAYLMSTLPSDADNVFITLTARDLNKSVNIICRAEQATTANKLRQAGADRIVMPTIVSARQMVRMITRPSTADLMELVAERKFLDVELDELRVESDTNLVGASVAESEAHRRHRLLVVAVKQQDGTMVFNPDAAYKFAEGDTLMLMGHHQDIEKFREFFRCETT